MASETIQRPNSFSNTGSGRIPITDYTSSSNLYEAPCDGYFNVRNDEGVTGQLRLMLNKSTLTSAMAIGGAAGSYAVFVRKGTKCYVSGTVTAANFWRLDDSW